MKQIYFSTRSSWREWLRKNHDQENGVWLVFNKTKTGRHSLAYEESVEEALCYGWIDSIIKRIDEERYCRMFTPRQDGSRWSITNQKRVKKVIKEGRMTEFGLAKIEAAKRLGNWKRDPRPKISLDIPCELAEALAQNGKAKNFFESLAPTCRNHFISWMVSAKRPETKAKRLKESLALLERGRKLGLK